MRGSTNVYNLPEHLQARSLTNIIANTEEHKFIVGSCSVKPERNNEIHILTY